jgi:effector-binding domain-containing protein
MSSDLKVLDLMPVPIISVRVTVPNAQVKSKTTEIYDQLWGFTESNRIRIAGPPYCIYHSRDAKVTDLECGFPTYKEEKGAIRIKSSKTPGGKVLFGVHQGAYEKIGETYAKMREHMERNGLVPTGLAWERYLNDPATVKKESDLATEIYLSIE